MLHYTTIIAFNNITSAILFRENTGNKRKDDFRRNHSRVEIIRWYFRDSRGNPTSLGSGTDITVRSKLEFLRNDSISQADDGGIDSSQWSTAANRKQSTKSPFDRARNLHSIWKRGGERWTTDHHWKTTSVVVIRHSRIGISRTFRSFFLSLSLSLSLDLSRFDRRGESGHGRRRGCTDVDHQRNFG